MPQTENTAASAQGATATSGRDATRAAIAARPHSTLHPMQAVPPARQPADALWQRLQAHHFDDPRDAHPYSARLQREAGWSHGHAIRVIEEYRRFLYLCLQMDGRACPSHAVDAAWHTHLLDSSRYFGDFGPRVLGRTLHHHPGRGGVDPARHRADYDATLRAYEQAFGEPPPIDIWPHTNERFAERVRQVNNRSHWVLAKPGWWPQRGALRHRGPALRAWAAVLALPLVAAVGCAPRTRGFHNQVTGPAFLQLYFYAILGLLAVGVLLAWLGRPATQPVRDRGLRPLEQGYLAAGPLRAIWTALASMMQAGQVAYAPAQERWQALQPPGLGTHPLQQALYAQLSEGTQPRDAMPALQAPLDALHRDLHSRGLLTAPFRDARGGGWLEWTYRAAWVSVLLFGAVRFGHGLMGGYPVGGLVVLMFVALLLWLMFSKILPHRLTREARSWLAGERRALRRRSGLGLTDPLMPTGLALVGAAALGGDLQPLRDALGPMTSRDGGGGGCGGSSCGGDGSGGGGGGCGGCGGGGGGD